MGISHSDHVAYGVQVELPESLPWWDFTEARPQDGKVMTMGAGAYDDDDYYLVIPDTWKSIEPGEPRRIAPYRASDEPYLSWDGLLVAAAEELKVPIRSEPAWLFLPDEG